MLNDCGISETKISFLLILLYSQHNKKPSKYLFGLVTINNDVNI